MAKFAAKDIVIAYLSGTTYIPIAQVDGTIEYDVGDTDEVEVTTFDSTSDYREYLPTFKTTSPLTLTGVYDPGVASHAWLRTNHGGAAQTFKITCPDTGSATEVFSAFVKGFSVNADMNGKLGFTATLRPTGAFTHTA